MAPNIPFCVIKPGSDIASREEARASLRESVQAYEEGILLLSISQAARLLTYVVLKTTKINGFQTTVT